MTSPDLDGRLELQHCSCHVMLYKPGGVTCCDAVDTDSRHISTDHNMTGATTRPCYHLYGHLVSSNIQQQDFGIQMFFF